MFYCERTRFVAGVTTCVVHQAADSFSCVVPPSVAQRNWGNAGNAPLFALTVRYESVCVDFRIRAFTFCCSRKELHRPSARLVWFSFSFSGCFVFFSGCCCCCCSSYRWSWAERLDTPQITVLLSRCRYLCAVIEEGSLFTQEQRVSTEGSGYRGEFSVDLEDSEDWFGDFFLPDFKLSYFSFSCGSQLKVWTPNLVGGLPAVDVCALEKHNSI